MGTVSRVPGKPNQLHVKSVSNGRESLFNLDDLSTIGKLDYSALEGDEELPPFVTNDAKVLPDGTVLNVYSTIGQQLIGGNFHVLARQDSPVGPRKAIAKVYVESKIRPGWVHDIPCTQNYAVVYDQPMCLSMLPNFVGNLGLFAWEGGRSHGTMNLVDLRTGEQEAFKVPPVLIYHGINSYEDEEQLTINGTTHTVRYFNYEAPVFAGPRSITDMMLRNLRSNNIFHHAQVVRYKLPIGFSKMPSDLQAALRARFAPKSTCIIEDLIPESQLHYMEMPSSSPLVKGVKNKYGFGMGMI